MRSPVTRMAGSKNDASEEIAGEGGRLAGKKGREDHDGKGTADHAEAEVSGRVVVVGIDGGASKTRAVVLSMEGEALAAATVRSSSAYHREPEEAADVVVAAASEALSRAGIAPPVTALGAGLAGADNPEVHRRLHSALEGAGLARAVLVDHDAAAALAGGTALAPGVVVIAGTGSIAFGIDGEGRRARAGGWGPLLDDEGSGYAVGRAVLRAAMRAHDGRGEPTALADAARRRFDISSLATLKVAVRGIGIDDVAALAVLAAEAASAGDVVALRIMQRAGEGLATMVTAVAAALGWSRRPFPLIGAGGMFESGDLIAGPMVSALEALACPAEPHAALLPPEVGAALLGARAAGLDAGALATRLRQGPGAEGPAERLGGESP